VKLSYNPYDYQRRESIAVLNIGGHNVPRIIADFSERESISPATFFPVGYNYSVPMDKWNINDIACDYVYVGNNHVDFEIPGTLGIIYNSEAWKELKNPVRQYPLFCGEEFFKSEKIHTELNFVAITKEVLTPEFISKIKNKTNIVLIADSFNPHAMPELRRLFISLSEQNISLPIIIKRNYKDISEQNFQLGSSAEIGALLLDGLGDGLWIMQQNCTSPQVVNSTAFGILQATRTRISKTEYISCPSCGRTLFDLQETTQKIRERTDHLKGIKIGIMGCIVNGPGEMADADYGYVGVGVGKISLYKGKEVVKKNVPSDNAVNELIDLIKEHGDWVEKP
jgi:(E)-4-hydroxy-3-methylbut-2-enyl-diphosphate synthase